MTPSYALNRLQLASEEGSAARPKPRQGTTASIVGRAFDQAILALERDAQKNGGERTGMLNVRLVFYRKDDFTEPHIRALEERFIAMNGVTVRRRVLKTRRYKRSPADQLWFEVTWPHRSEDIRRLLPPEPPPRPPAR